MNHGIGIFMKDIIIVQYCQSEQHINDLTGGWTDTSLTELGRKQAERISNRIANEFQYDEYTLISSDLIRAKETAEIMALSGNLWVV
jgi:probable phosphoglycerate mutase